ncbi:MAG: hypothetical protein WBE34_17220 [Candidatus Nitrosopolaris sp.]|jgi:hypothetical protein
MTAIIAKVIISSCHLLIPQREDGTGLTSQAVTNRTLVVHETLQKASGE